TFCGKTANSASEIRDWLTTPQASRKISPRVSITATDLANRLSRPEDDPSIILMLLLRNPSDPCTRASVRRLVRKSSQKDVLQIESLLLGDETRDAAESACKNYAKPNSIGQAGR